MSLNKVIDKTVEFLFSKDNRKWVFLLFIIGFVLRTFVALRVPFNADEMVHGTHAIGFIDSGKLQIMDQDAVWFFLTDLSMKIFGVNMFGIRFLSILFGALMIILIYLLGREIFNEKIAVIAASIFTFSPYQLLESRAEMDMAMAFFVFLSLYLLILFLKTDKSKFFIGAWIFLGIAVMVKQIAIIFIPAFILFLLFYNWKYKHRFNLKQIFLVAIILLILVLPVLTFNYLLYKDKGIVDLQFSRFTNLGNSDTYASLADTTQPFKPSLLFFPHGESLPGFIEGLRIFFEHETLIVLLFAILGIVFLLRQKNRFKWLLVLAFLFPFLFLSGTSLLSTHFVWGSFFISLLAALAITRISRLFHEKKSKKIFVYAVLILILVFSAWGIQASNSNGFFGKNEVEKLVDFKENEIGDHALVITDSRIYRGQTVFMFWDRAYLEANYFSQITALDQQSTQPKAQVETYFIECVIDDCGWGTVKDQPEFNQSMEGIVNFFASNTELVKTIVGVNGEPYFKVYKQVFELSPEALAFVGQTHEWFFYPVAYKPKKEIFDNYDTYTLADDLLDKVAHLVLYLEVLIAIISMILLFYLSHKSS